MAIDSDNVSDEEAEPAELDGGSEGGMFQVKDGENPIRMENL